nr:MAG TPA: hypothetical protein [Caudoviricetes sp.]
MYHTVDGRYIHSITYGYVLCTIWEHSQLMQKESAQSVGSFYICQNHSKLTKNK